MSVQNLYRLAAFADPSEAGKSGNPAGVWVGESLPDTGTMQHIAAEVGYSETAFLAPAAGVERTVRYYSPLAEVAFCGHATIAAGVLLGRTDGDAVYTLQTGVGEVPVDVRTTRTGTEATLTSVVPRHQPVDADLLNEVLAILGWESGDLDSQIPVVNAFAGAWHLVLAAKDMARLARLDYPFERLKSLMLAHELTTLQLVWRERADLVHSRNPFPVGGVVEDPATGAAAAAFGGYLRDAGLLPAPASFIIHQGRAMGRPSLIKVDVPVAGGIRVSGSAVDIRE